MELSAKMSSVHKDIEKLKRRVDEFNDFSELDMMHLYVKDALIVQRKVADITDVIEWIHKVRDTMKY